MCGLVPADTVLVHGCNMEPGARSLLQLQVSTVLYRGAVLRFSSLHPDYGQSSMEQYIGLGGISVIAALDATLCGL